jgi:hypothetical protein
MTTSTLYLAWQDREASRQWFPIGRLDADTENSEYRFRYIGGADRAKREVKFRPLVGFPHIEQDYRSPELFPIFQNRVMSPKRPDFPAYMRALDLGQDADPAEMLAVNGGRRMTDSFEVFPKLVKNDDGSFVCRFFLHGWRHTNEGAQERINSLAHGEPLYVAMELTNPRTGLAVQIQTTDYQMIGWAPRYLVDDLTAAMAESPGEYATSVVRVNPPPTPASQRVLVEMSSRWDKHEPMSGMDYQPLVE